MKPPLEKTIEKAVCAYATEKGCLVRKNDGISYAGRPDRIFHYNGRTWYIEFKRKGGVVSTMQRREMEKLGGQGILCFVIDDIEEGKRVIEGMTR
jgi:hypothetical protein